MSTYAFAPDSRALIVSWATGSARRARTVTVFADGVDEEAVDRLVAALDGLAEAMWATYVHSAAQYGDPDEPNSAAWRWASERAGFSDALAAVTSAVLPENGMLTISYCQVEEAGNRLGRALHALDPDETLMSAIAADVATEQEAIESAEAGDLTGRAAQAMAMSRIGASPTQLHVAWTALLADPLGCHRELLTQFEPSAAAVAAAGCLRSAAEIAADVSGVGWTHVVMESDNIEALPVLTPTAVLDLLDQGATEREAITQLLVEADAVSEGRLDSVAQLVAVVEQMQTLKEAGVSDEGLDLRLTPLDPRRSARDLLEDLLSAIDGCFTLWREYQDSPSSDNDDTADEVDVEDDPAWIAWGEVLAKDFADQLRVAMEMAGSPN